MCGVMVLSGRERVEVTQVYLSCVVQALLELEANPDIKSTLREVYFSSAKAS